MNTTEVWLPYVGNLFHIVSQHFRPIFFLFWADFIPTSHSNVRSRALHPDAGDLGFSLFLVTRPGTLADDGLVLCSFGL